MCVEKGQIQLLEDLTGATFRVGSGEYADDMASLSASITRLQSVCGRIGLNISVKKTEWMYLHNPTPTAMGECRAQRTPNSHCCDKIQIMINGKPTLIKHVSCFRYLGSTLSENGGVDEDTRFRVLQATLCLSKYDAIWKSELMLRQKVHFLKSHVFPTLVYGAECGNHTQLQLRQIDVFLNICRRRLLSIGKRRADGKSQRRCRLLTPLDLLSRRWLNFVTKVVTRPACHVARNMLYAEVDKESVARRVGGRDQSSYLNTIALDLRYLYSGAPAERSLDDFLSMAFREGPKHAKKVLMALKPDIARGSSLKLVTVRPRLKWL